MCGYNKNVVPNSERMERGDEFLSLPSVARIRFEAYGHANESSLWRAGLSTSATGGLLIPVCLVKEPFDCAQGKPQLASLNESKILRNYPQKRIPLYPPKHRTCRFDAKVGR